MSHQPNARFWVYVNGGPVKITLEPGDELSHYEGGPCEEGYSREWTTWMHEGDRVTREWHEDSRDCVGRLDRHSKDCAHLSRLAEFVPYSTIEDDPNYAGVMWPEWQPISSVQRDYTAEAAGY